ncbi:hypothetical protein GF319_06020 [Candidatus Bathyarchaeota archaeon]|nr:hypothetical protein [Candidatus Bathyarchaeota archaeon]
MSLICLVWGLRDLNRKRLIDDTPTLKAMGVFIGLAELKGTAESENPLISHLTETRCVYYTYCIQEHWRRQVTETYRDTDGNTKTRTRTESGWKRVAHGGEAPSFYLKDETGVIKIDPEGASVHGDNVLRETITRRDPRYYGKGPRRSVRNSRHRRRLTETLIPIHSPIYVIGQANERKDIVAPLISYDEEEPLFVISTGGEKSVRRVYRNRFLQFFTLGLILSLLPLFFLRGFTSRIFFSSIVFYLSATSFGYTIVVYNSLVSLRNRVDQAWSLIDIQLKRREDLIPQLTEVVEGYQRYEETTQENINKLRSQIDDQMTSEAITPILNTIADNIPELKAREQFIRLQHTLEETENRIALARDYYNQITVFYNTRIEIIPGRYISKLAALKKRPLWRGESFKRAKDEPDLAI